MKLYQFELLYEPAHDKTYNKTCATSKDSDQPAHSCCLVRVFTDRMCLIYPPTYPKTDKREPLPYVGGCTGWSESLLVTQVLLLVLSCAGSQFMLRYTNQTKRHLNSLYRNITIWTANTMHLSVKQTKALTALEGSIISDRYRSDLGLHRLPISQSRFYRFALWRHSDKNSAALNYPYLDFVDTRGLISLVNDNHVDNNLKESLMYVYLGSIVNNRPKNGPFDEQCIAVNTGCLSPTFLHKSIYTTDSHNAI